jgi:lysophospholipase L1-like esterase
MSILKLISKKTDTIVNPPLGSLNLKRMVIVCDGNSLTAGNYGTPPSNYPDILKTLYPFAQNGVQVLNFGNGGQQTSSMIADAVTQIDSLYTNAHTNIVVFWEVGNDLFYNENVSAAIDRAKTYLLARKTAGFKTIACTVTPRDFVTGMGYTQEQSDALNYKYNEANNQIRSLSSTYVDAICDLAADARLDSVSLDYYAPDGIHFIKAGNDVIAELIRNTIISI